MTARFPDVATGSVPAVKVKDPSGQTWRVTRRWVPWRRRVRGASKAWEVVPTPPSGDDPISGAIALVVLVVFSPIIAIALLLTVLAAIEFAVILLLIPLVLLGRVFFGRRWIVEMRRGFTPYHQQDAGDWAASRTAIARIADAIGRGDLPLQTIDLPDVEDLVDRVLED